ncbi:MAG: ATP-grasp fold amidoligase family protein [Arenibacter sp.]
MKTFFKRFYQNSALGFYILKPIVEVYHFFLFHKYLSDKDFIKKLYKKGHGVDINLENPKTLNEKINWLKLNYDKPLFNKIADKFAVREYVKEKIGEEYLVPLLFHSTSLKDIVPAKLPDMPFILKVNHNSSGGIMIKNKNENVNWNQIQNTLRWNMADNYYWHSREKQYKNIKPRIIAEKLLIDSKGNSIPLDYKVHCFNGKARMIQVDMGRGTNNHCRNWYSTKWEREPYKWTANKGAGKFTEPSENDIEKPKSFDEMISQSEKLAKDFIYVRVDWYDIDGKLYFGELTLHHDGGLRPIEPGIWDLKLGEQLQLPIV